MLEFGAALPRIRKRVQADLAAPIGAAPRRETVLATLVRLLDTTLVRVGNDEYARTNRSFGLTTLRNRHADVKGSRIRLQLSRQERHRARGRPRRSARRPGRPPLPGDARPGPVPVRGRGRRGARASARPTSTTTSARRPAPTSPPRTSAPGTAASMRSASGPSSAPPTPSCRRSANQLLAEVARAPRQHGGGLQEVVRPSAGPGDARHPGRQRGARPARRSPPRRPERRRAPPARFPRPRLRSTLGLAPGVRRAAYTLPTGR